jgi:hypothetical protein
MCDAPFLAAVHPGTNDLIYINTTDLIKKFFLGVVDRDDITTLQVRKHTYQSLGSL